MGCGPLDGRNGDPHIVEIPFEFSMPSEVAHYFLPSKTIPDISLRQMPYEMINFPSSGFVPSSLEDLLGNS